MIKCQLNNIHTINDKSQNVVFVWLQVNIVVINFMITLNYQHLDGKESIP